MDKKIIRLLVVDDSPDDAEIAVEILRRAGYMLKSQRVQDAVSMQAALGKGEWDVVVSEHTLGHFSAHMALDMLKRTALDLPVIVVAKKITDADMVKIMRAGARDVVLKQQAARLLPIIERELQVATERSALLNAAASIKEAEEKHRVLVEGSREAICYTHDGMHIDANRAYLNLFGYDSAEELEGIPVLNMVDNKDHSRLKDLIRRAGKDKESNLTQEFVAVKKDGTRFAIEVAVTSIVLRGEKCHQVNVTDISQRKSFETKLQFLNQRDPLTGLFNRHAFIQELTKSIEKAKSGVGDAGLMYIDVDRLRDINDAIGHAAGDRLLLKLARLFREKAREQDVIARFGGDEFMVLMLDVSKAQAKSLSDIIEKSLKEATFSEGGKTYECNCSTCLVTIDNTAENAQKILAIASSACADQKAKKLAADSPPPKPAVEPPPARAAEPPVSAPPAAPVVTGSAWSRKIEQAMTSGRMQLKFQPIINLHAEPEENYEVLLRMLDDDGTSIRAGEFIHAAEDSGQIAILDRWMLEQSLDTLGKLHKGGKRTSFFVNISSAALSDPEISLLIQRKLAEFGLTPRSLVLQVNESSIVKQPDQVQAFIKSIRRMNCRMAIDDFNARPESIKLLRGSSFDFMTLTGPLVSDLVTDQICQMLIETLVGVAKNLDKLVIAKYVEDAQSLSLLWNYGVHYVQGNYFQQPESELNYEFAGETISSDQAVAGWVTAGQT